MPLVSFAGAVKGPQSASRPLPIAALPLPLPALGAVASPAVLDQIKAQSARLLTAEPLALQRGGETKLVTVAGEFLERMRGQIDSGDYLGASRTLGKAFDAAGPRGGSAGGGAPYRLGRRILSDRYALSSRRSVKVAFFDADSTLRVSLSGSVSANGPRDVMLLPWVAGKLAALSRQGYLIAIVSNQAGIPGHVSLENADKALAYAIDLIRRQGGDVHYYDFAEHDNRDRKPRSGMAARLQRVLKKKFGPGVIIHKASSLMVGDSAYKKAGKGHPGDTRPDGRPGTHFSNSDRLFAQNYGIRFMEPTDFFGWRRFGIDVFTRHEEAEDFLRKYPLPPPEPEKEIFLAQAAPAADGRRSSGHDQSEEIDKMVARYGGRVKNLNGAGPRQIFQTTFALEAETAVRADVLRDLRAIAGLESYPLAELVQAGLKAGPRAFTGAEDFTALKDRLSQGFLPDRLRAFAELASLLESAAPDQVAAIAEALRNEALSPLYSLAGFMANSFGLIHGDLRQRLREEQELPGETEREYVAMEKAAYRALNEPAVRARFEPLRRLFTRALATIDRLDTGAARSYFLQLLPHADYAGLEHVASHSELRRKYVPAWLGLVAESVVETIAGLRLGPNRPEGWHGSARSGPYQHLSGGRQSLHLYEWRPGRFDPGEMSQELLLLLGMSDQSFSATQRMLTLLDFAQRRLPEMTALNRENTKSSGSRWDAHVEGHTAVDRLLSSLVYNPYLGLLPGFDEAAYVCAALGFFQDAQARIDEPGLLKQIVDSAVSFLANLARSPLLESRPDLRAQAVGLWKEVSAKAAESEIALETRLDGVIDPRPELRPWEPRRLAADANERERWAVWQVAASPDGRFIARASADRIVSVWDAATGRLVKSIRLMDARQHYGDLANSLGVAWTPEGRLLVSTLHQDADKKVHNKVRIFAVAGRKKILGPENALSEVLLPDVHVLRHMPAGPGGQFLASEIEHWEERGRFAGSDVRFFALDGGQIAEISDAALHDVAGNLALTGAPRLAAPRLELWDVSDPRQPKSVTPAWLTAWTAAWRERNPAGEFGYWPRLPARLGTFRGRRALLLQERGILEILDLETGDRALPLAVPNGWTAFSYATDAAGKYLATVAAAPGAAGGFNGRAPERLMVWDLATGTLLMERQSEQVRALVFSADGRRLVAAGRAGVEVFDLP